VAKAQSPAIPFAKFSPMGYVLSFFDAAENSRKNYLAYIEKGLAQGHRPELVGGGLIRSLGGWSEVLASRRRDEKQAFDQRILGDGDFVNHIVSGLDNFVNKNLRLSGQRMDMEAVAEKVAGKYDISIEELASGSRRKQVAVARRALSRICVQELGYSGADAARFLGFGVRPGAAVKSNTFIVAVFRDLFALLCIFFEFQFTILRKIKHWPPGDFPVIAIKVGEVSTESTPGGFLWFFYDTGTSRRCTSYYGNNVVLAAGVVGKRDAAKSTANDRNLRRDVFGQFLKWVECDPGSWKLDEGDAIKGCVWRCAEYSFIKFRSLDQVGYAKR
jgi:hypothetical protein